MRVLFVASECFPFMKTGGLADVIGALPKALTASGADVRVMLPYYGSMDLDVDSFSEIAVFDDVFGGPTRLIRGAATGLDLVLIDAEHLYGRTGNPYVQSNGHDWEDNHLRFGALCRIAAHSSINGLDGWQPDVVHLHDWHTGLVPLYQKRLTQSAPPCCFTIHNLSYQGVFDGAVRQPLDLAGDDELTETVGYFANVNFMKSALMLSDRITAVSPTYADEVVLPDFGMGLDGILRSRLEDFSGILNGIDTVEWDPSNDAHLTASYDSTKFVEARAANKAALEIEFGLEPAPTRPLLSVVSRLTQQKGIDIFLGALADMIAAGARLVVLGSGDADFESALREAALQIPEDVAVRIGYDEGLAHRMQGGADAILVPSRFEPCGLTQLCGLRYGCIPVVSRVGGLADTVVDANSAALSVRAGTGFQFSPLSSENLAGAVRRLVGVYQSKSAWRGLVRRAMRHPVGWERSAEDYLDLYRTMSERRG